MGNPTSTFSLKIRLGSVRSPTSTANKMQAFFIRLTLLAVLLFIYGAAGFSSTLPAEDALDPLNVRRGKGGARHRHDPDINSGRAGRAAQGGWSVGDYNIEFHDSEWIGHSKE